MIIEDILDESVNEIENIFNDISNKVVNNI